VRRPLSSGAILLLSALLAGCPDFGDPVDPGGAGAGVGNGGGGGGPPVSFSADVQPIFTSRCALPLCHSGASPQGNMNLEAGNAYGNTVGVTSFAYAPAVRVVAGEPDSSVLFNKVTNTMRFGSRMPPPPDAPLGSGEIETLRAWIAEGALDD
jgi:hypothetical protein